MRFFLLVLAMSFPVVAKDEPAPKNAVWASHGNFTKSEIFEIKNLNETFLDYSPTDTISSKADGRRGRGGGQGYPKELFVQQENAKRHFVAYCPGDAYLGGLNTKYMGMTRSFTTRTDKTVNMSDRKFLALRCAFFEDPNKDGQRVSKKTCDQVEFPSDANEESKKAYAACLQQDAYGAQECIIPYFKEKVGPWTCGGDGLLTGLVSRRKPFNYERNIRWHECCELVGKPKTGAGACSAEETAKGSELDYCASLVPKREYRHLCCKMGSPEPKAGSTEPKKTVRLVNDCKTTKFAANEDFNFTCERHKAIAAIVTEYSEAANDRSFAITCCSLLVEDAKKP